MIAVVFPGQGSQRPGMGRDLFENSGPARAVFETVAAATEIDVAALCFESDEETLRQTQNAQLALYTCSFAAHSALRARVPDLLVRFMAGHSVGEYAALAASGAVSVEDGARLVRRRGELMAASGKARPGSMAAILGLDVAEVEALCKEVADKGVCVLANDNCPGQLVISGDIDAVQAASAIAPDRGAKRALPLNVSGAFHSPLMAESSEELGRALIAAAWQPPAVPVYSNVTAEPGQRWPELLTSQLRSPVRWADSVRNMVRDGARLFIECGSGEVLTGLLRRIDDSAQGLKVVDVATLEETAHRLSEALV